MRRGGTMRERKAELLWFAFGFAALQLGLGLAITLWIPRLRDPEYAVRAASFRQRVAQADRPGTVVMLGSSRGLNGLRGLDLEAHLHGLGLDTRVCNLAVAGGGALTGRLYLDRLLAARIRPDLVLVDVIPYLLDSTNNSDKTKPATRLDWRELPLLARHGANARQQWTDRLVAQVVPTWSYREKMISAIAPRLLPLERRADWHLMTDVTGHFPYPNHTVTPESRRANVARMCAEYAEALRHFSFRETSSAPLRDLLARCRDKNIPVAVVLMPEESTLRATYSGECRALSDQGLAALCREFDAAVIDARTWIGDDGFADIHHLLPNGAAQFTERLGREALPELLRRPQFAALRRRAREGSDLHGVH